MTESPKSELSEEAKAHRRYAVNFFNHVWTLLDAPVRTPQQEMEMLHATHASAYHWSHVGNAENFCIGEWQVSRVYAVLQRAEPALFHAQKCLEICDQNGLQGFHRAFAHEALARGNAVDENFTKAAEQVQLAGEIPIDDPDDRKLLQDDLATIPLSPNV